MPKRVVSRLSEIFEPPDIASNKLPLTAEEIAYFKEHGFLFKRSLLDREQVADALDRVWELLDRYVFAATDSGWRLKRDDPATWRSPKWAPMLPADQSGFFEGRQRTAIHGRTVKIHEIGNEPFLLDLVPNHPSVREIAQKLLANRLKTSERTRGVYAFFPDESLSSDERSKRVRGEGLGPHTDRICQQLNVCTYLDDVPPRSGGFTVYPGSHKIMFQAHQFEANWSPTDRFNDALREVVETITPVEFTAQQGDVVFWHGRTVHTAGIHVGDTIRWAVFADFTEDRPILDADEHRACGQYEWFKDAKLFRDDVEVGEDMWRSWRI